MLSNLSVSNSECNPASPTGPVSSTLTRGADERNKGEQKMNDTNNKKTTYDCEFFTGPDGPFDLPNPKASTLEEIATAMNKQYSDRSFYVHDDGKSLCQHINQNGVSSIEFIDAPICKSCNQKISSLDIKLYQQEGGEGNPAVCFDCAETEVR